MQLLILFAACGSGDKGADVASDDTAVVDADDDGFLARVDCDDGDAAVHPGADDVPGDGVDQDCADGDALADGDSGGDPGDDTGGDRDAADADGDGYAGTAYGGPDCDDEDASVHPDASDTARDGTDQDCDGADLTTAGLAAGELVISEVMYDPDAVDDADGEWFEVYNATAYVVNLAGLVVSDDAGFAELDRFEVDVDLVVAAGGRAVFGVEGDPAINGGVTLDYDFPGSGVNFNNGADDLYVGVASGASFLTIDAVAWDEAAGWPAAKGFSIELNDGRLSASSNDAASAWCLATSTAGSTSDKGSPGEASSGC